MKRKLVYWGIPIFGTVYGTIVSIIMKKRREDEYEIFDNQMDAFYGALIWFAIISIGRILYQLLR